MGSGQNAAKAPGHDGHILEYAPAAGGERSTWQPIIYVNGMATSPDTHATTALAIAELVGRPIYGLYNLTGGSLASKLDALSKAVDAYCGALERNPMVSPLALAGPAGWVAAKVTNRWQVDACDTAAKTVAQHRTDAATIDDFVQTFGDWSNPATTALPKEVFQVMPKPIRLQLARRAFVSSNLAARALFDFLHASMNRGAVPFIVAHSQGNLIVANVLSALKFVLGGSGSIRGFVYGLASPATTWVVETRRGPARLAITTYTFKEDVVTWASLGRSYANGAKVYSHGPGVGPGVGVQHDVKRYLERTEFGRDIRRDLGLPPPTLSNGGGGSW